MWEESCMGGILCGRNPMREESCVVGILGGMNPVWEESCWEEFHDYPAGYSQLGTASSLEELRSTLEKSLGVAGDTLRFILIQLAVPVPDYVIDRCPAPEWVIMRSKNKEKFILILFLRKAQDQELSSKAYTIMKTVISSTKDSTVSVQSLTWGCSSSFYNYLLCKITLSCRVPLFNLNRNQEELEDKLASLVNQVADAVAQDSFNIMNLFGDEDEDHVLKLGI